MALDKRVPHAALVATQVKYLGRAAAKLPSYRAARCILPPRAFEQASSEACAAHKRIGGEAVLDLTCGLGVDAFALSRRFGRVVTLERDPLLARIARDNFARLGVTNVEVVCASAEEYLARTGERFDWVYADPDRRDAAGRKQVRLEACSPDIVALMPAVRRVAGRLCLKNSPLFDVDAAFALFGGCETEVVSLGRRMQGGNGLCRRPRAPHHGHGARTGKLRPAAVRGRECTPARSLSSPDATDGSWCQTWRCRRRGSHAPPLRGRADLWSNEGYGFAASDPGAVLGRVFGDRKHRTYDPKALRRTMRGERAELMKRDFLATARIAADTGIREGRRRARLAFTRIGGRLWTVRLR